MSRPLLISVACPMAFLLACGGGGSSGNDAGSGSGSGHPDGHPAIDAAPLDGPLTPFGCSGFETPTTAPDPVTLAGTVQTLSGTSVVAASGATVKALTASETVLATATSDGSGAYSLSLPSGGEALDVHLRATLSGDRDTTLYPATPLYHDTSAGYLVVTSQSDFDFVAELSGVSQSGSKGAVAVAVLDCLGTSLAGATVSTSPGGDVVYINGGQPDTSATATDSSGLAFVFNVPAGAVTISASASGHTLRSHAVKAEAGVTTTAAIQP